MLRQLGCCSAQFHAGAASSAAGFCYDGKGKVQCCDLCRCVGRFCSAERPGLRHVEIFGATQPVVYVAFVIVEFYETWWLADDFHFAAVSTL